VAGSPGRHLERARHQYWIAATGTIAAALFTGGIAGSNWSSAQVNDFQKAITIGLTLTDVATALVGFGIIRSRRGIADSAPATSVAANRQSVQARAVRLNQWFISSTTLSVILEIASRRSTLCTLGEVGGDLPGGQTPCC